MELAGRVRYVTNPELRTLPLIEQFATVPVGPGSLPISSGLRENKGVARPVTRPRDAGRTLSGTNRSGGHTMRDRGARLAICLGCLCLLLAANAFGAGQDDVRVQQFPDPPPGSIGLRGEERYSLTSGDVIASLSYVPSSLALTLRVEGRHGPTPLAEQAAVLAPLLARFLLDHPKTQHLSVLLVDHSEIVTRLATVLSSCSGWNGRTGRPMRGSLGQFLVDTLNRHDLAAEIAKVFADRGYRFSAQGASMITAAHRAEVGKVVPTDIVYLGFVADQAPENERRVKWPTQLHSSTC